MTTLECAASTGISRPPARHCSDWAGFVCFSLIGLWLLWSGWLPVVRASWLAGLLILTQWLTPFATAAGFLFRKPLLSGETRLAARINSYFVTFGIPAYFAIMRDDLRDISKGPRFTAAVALLIVANVLALSCTWSLRRAFSIEPQARMLITTGPYQYARHPLYSLYVIRSVLQVLLFANAGLSVLTGAWFVALLYRVRCEERVLGAQFAEYKQFKRRVWMFSPPLWGCRSVVSTSADQKAAQHLDEVPTS